MGTPPKVQYTLASPPVPGSQLCCRERPSQIIARSRLYRRQSKRQHISKSATLLTGKNGRTYIVIAGLYLPGMHFRSAKCIFREIFAVGSQCLSRPTLLSVPRRPRHGGRRAGGGAPSGGAPRRRFQRLPPARPGRRPRRRRGRSAAI